MQCNVSVPCDGESFWVVMHGRIYCDVDAMQLTVVFEEQSSVSCSLFPMMFMSFVKHVFQFVVRAWRV